MPEMGYADKYSSVGWKATVPESSIDVDAIGIIGELVVEFKYDNTTDPSAPRLINRRGGTKKPADIWPGVPDGGSYTVILPLNGANSYRNAVLLKYVESGLEYYLELYQAGFTSAYNETVAQAISTGMLNAAHTCRITESLSSVVPATHVQYSQDSSSTWTNYNLIANSAMSISTATKSDNTWTQPADEYWYYNGFSIRGDYLTSYYKDAGIHTYCAISSVYYRCLSPELGNSDGALDRVCLIMRSTITLLDTLIDPFPQNVYDYDTEWYDTIYYLFDFQSVEYGVMIGNTFYKIFDLLRDSGSGTWVSDEYNSTAFSCSINSGLTTYYCGNNLLVEQTGFSVKIIAYPSTVSRRTWSWNGTMWVSAIAESYSNSMTEFVYRQTSPTTVKYENVIRLSEGSEIFVASCPVGSAFPYPHPINYSTWRFIPHYGQAYFSGASILLYKDWDPASVNAYACDDSTYFLKGTHIEYIDPTTSETHFRVSIAGLKSVMWFDFGNSMDNTPTLESIPLMTTYSDGTVATMSRPSWAITDISGGGAFAYDLIKRGATILKIY